MARILDGFRRLLPVACLLLGTGPGWSHERVVSENLAANPSFETLDQHGQWPLEWSGDRQVFSLCRETVRSGDAALRFANDDPQRYRLATQRIELRPGAKYRICVWVKTEDLRGDESGATVCVEWRDQQGQWLGGVYPSGVKGTRDWTRIEAVARLPQEARDFTLSCYVRRGMTGTAWFDDVQVVQLADPPLRTMLLAPVYRGRISAEGPEQVRVRWELNLNDYDFQPEQLRLAWELLDESGQRVDWQGGPATAPPSTIEPPAEGAERTLAFPASGLPVGTYRLILRLLDPSGGELQSVAHRLTRVADDFRPRRTIDQQRRLLVDGQPFFPLGMYFGAIKAEDLQVYADSKFNCLMAYGSPTRQQMDLAEQHGLKVIYSIKDWYFGSRYCPPDIRSVEDEEPKIRERVRAFRDHPALLAWYLNDELPQSFMPQLNAHQRFVEEEDPDHPTWVVLYQYREVNDYRDSFDVIGTDPYPIGRGPASDAGRWTAETFRQVHGSRPLWQVPQVFNWANYRSVTAPSDQHRTPTFDEMRSMAWQCIAEGATGLIFYSWYDIQRNPDVPQPVQWERLKKIAAEIDRYAAVLLSGEPAPAVHVGGETPDSPCPPWLHWTARRHEGRIYLFVVNNGDGEGRFTVTWPDAAREIVALDEDRSLGLENQRFQDELGELQVRVYAAQSPAADPQE
jgi:hypothetical protein